MTAILSTELQNLNLITFKEQFYHFPGFESSKKKTGRYHFKSHNGLKSNNKDEPVYDLKFDSIKDS